MRIAITGGAGFVGSHLAEELTEEHEVIIFDNLSSGREDNIPDDARFYEIDIKEGIPQDHLEDVDVMFHLAANPKVNTFPEDRDKDFRENLEGKKNVLDACVDADVDDIVFTSSSVVYGEEADIPTPEEHVLDPISQYGATKAGGEHMMRVYGRTFDLDATIVRLANIVGGRNPKGVTYDFVKKLEDEPSELTILGNGKQKKSYLHVEDTVEGIISAWRAEETVFNIGNHDSTSVDRIADIVADEMGIDPDYSYTGGEKGWTGDVPEMRLDIEKLRAEGWSPSKSSDEAVRKTARELIE